MANDKIPPASTEKVEAPIQFQASGLEAQRHADILAETGFARKAKSGYQMVISAFELGQAAAFSPRDLAEAGVVDASKSSEEGQDRGLEQVQKITVRKSSERKPGDKPAHYRINEDGKIEQLRNPDKSTQAGDDEMIVEVDDGGANQIRAMSEKQKASIRQMIAYIEGRYAAARMAPQIPQDLLDALNNEPQIPAPVARVRSGGYNGHRMGSPRTEMPPMPSGGYSPAQVGRSPSTDAAESRVFDSMPSNPQIPTSDAFKSFIDRVVDAVSRNEGSFTSVNWNDNGHGVSIGKAQFNQKSGEMPSLLKRFHEANPEKFNEVFGPYAQDMLRESYVRNVPITKGSDLGNRIQNALAVPEFQQVQTELMRNKVVKAFELANKYGHTSELFVAEVADMGNQFGWGGVEGCLRKSNAANISDERAAIRALQEAGQDKWARRAGRDQKLAQVFSADKQASA